MFNFLWPLLVGASLNISIQNGTDPRLVPVNQRVELLSVRGETMEDMKTCVTNTRGICRFEITTDAGVNYVARTLFEGLQFLSNIFTGASAPKNLSIRVYKSKSDLVGLVASERQLLFTPTESGLQVEDEWTLDNRSRFALLGNNEITFSLSLPENAHDLRFETGFAEEDTKIEGQNIRSARPLLPGKTRFGLRYQIETSKTSFVFHDSNALTPERLFIAGPEGTLRLRSDLANQSLEKTGWKFLGEKRYTTWAVRDPRNEVKLVVGDLPLRWKVGPFFPLWGLVGLLLVFVWRKKWNKTSAFATTQAATVDEKRRADLIKDLKALKNLRSKSLISDSEFQRRRILILREIAHEVPS